MSPFNRVWKPADIGRVKALAAQGLSARQVALMMTEELGRNIARGGLIGLAMRNGFSFNSNSFYNTKEAAMAAKKRRALRQPQPPRPSRVNRPSRAKVHATPKAVAAALPAPLPAPGNLRFKNGILLKDKRFSFAHHCRYTVRSIEGPGAFPLHFYCGEEVIELTPYCGHHTKVMRRPEKVS